MSAPPAVPTIESRARPSRGPSLTTQIFIGLLAGILIGFLWPASGVGDQAAGRRVPAHDQDDHRAAAVLHAGRRHRGQRRSEVDGPHRAEGDHLVRARDDHRARDRPGDGERVPARAPASRCRSADTQELAAMAKASRAAGTSCCTCFPTSIVDAMAKGDILQIVVFATILRRRARGHRREGQAARRAARQRGAGDVQVHRLRDAVRADRRDGRHRRDGRRARARDSGHAREARAGDVRGRWRSSCCSSSAVRRSLIRVPFLAFLRAIREPFLIALHHGEQRGGAAQGARGHGALRRAEAHRQLRAADRLQLESRRQHAVSVGWPACSSRSSRASSCPSGSRSR